MKKLILLFAVSTLSACAFFGASQEEIDAAQDAFVAARESVDIAAANQLDTSGAAAQLEKARLEIDDENYEESLAFSKSAQQIADELNSEYDRQRAAEMEQEKKRQLMMEQQAMAEKKIGSNSSGRQRACRGSG